MSAPANFASNRVKYAHAEQNILFVLFGFALSVLATRSFLEATGYPQIASGEFHIAHVMWGGLLLFAAALLLLIWRGRKIHRVGSLLTGIGFGLFIDEVGKFITQSNDYFYPLAAPIIYAFFLLTVFIYTRVRGQQTGDAQADVHGVLEILERAMDPNLPVQEETQIRQRLSRIASESSHPDAARLASHALGFLEEKKDRPKNLDTGSLNQWRERLRAVEVRWISANRLKAALITGFIFLALRGLLAAVAASLFIFELSKPAGWLRLTSMPWSGEIEFGMPRIFLLIVIMIFESVIGFLLLAGAGLLLARRLRRGLMVGYWGLLFSLTVLYLPILYFEQFEVIATILLQFGLLLGVIRYRSRYLDSEYQVRSNQAERKLTSSYGS